MTREQKDILIDRCLQWLMWVINQILKNRSRKFDAVVRRDERNKDYKIQDVVATMDKQPTIHTKTWDCNIVLNQGREGACTGFALAHELRAEPIVCKNVDRGTAFRFYKLAKKNDQWAGEDYEGSSVEGALKAAQQLGYYNEYRWAFSIEDLKLAISEFGPAILGITWWSNMSNINRKGFIQPTGKKTGRHAILCNGYNAEEDYFILHNSWGKLWGFNGRCKIKATDLDKLLKDYGVAGIPMNRINEDK